MTDEAQDQQSEGAINPSNAKLAAAAMGGYVLGRTKKGKAAIRLAMWLNGSKSPGPKVLEQARTGVTNVLASEQGKQILGQIKGPLLEAARQAAIQVAMNRVSAISKGLASRTQKLNEVSGQAGDKAEETVSGAGDKGEETVTDTTDQVDGALSELTGKSGKSGKNRQSEDSAEEVDEDEGEADEVDDDEEEDEADEQVDASAGDGKKAPSAEAEDEEADEDEDEEEEDEDEDEADDEAEEQPKAKKRPAKTAKKKEPSNA